MRKSFLLAISFFFLISSTSFGQVAFWQKYLGGEGYDQGKRLLRLEDGTLIIGGDGFSKQHLGNENHGESDVFVLKYSTQGAIFWKKTLGGSKEDALGDLIQTSDGGFLVVGKSASQDGDIPSNRGGFDVWVTKLSASGNIEWVRILGGINDDQGYTAIECTNGNFLIAGECGSPNTAYARYHHGGLDGWMAMLDKSGNSLWEKQYGGEGNEQIRRVHQINEKEFMVIAATDSKDGDVPKALGQKDLWVFRVDEQGEIISSRIYGGQANDMIHTSLKDKNGDFLLAGTTFSADGDVAEQRGLGDCWLVKIDAKGQLLWNQTYGGRRPEGFLDIQATQDGQYVLCGLTKSRTREGDIEYNSGYYDGWIVKCDSTGKRLWSRTVGYQGKDVLNSILEAPEGGYLLLGYATQAREGFVLPDHKGIADFWLLNVSDPRREGVKPYRTPPVLSGTIKDKKTGAPVKATITLTDNRTLDSLASTETMADGSFAMLMPSYGLVSINVLGEGYMFHGENFMMDTVIDRTNIQRTYELASIEVGAKLILKNTYFNTAKWDLLAASNAELERVKKFLELNPRVRVKISGHTDNTGNKRTKEQLSLNRANSVKDYLKEKGVPAYQMAVKGYGMYRPIAPNTTPAGRAKNRRVEIEVMQK
ncbi:MAG: OmpA family protein [Bacteroidota bacterium]